MYGKVRPASSPAPSTPDALRQRYEYWMRVFGKIAKDVGLKPQ
jgi:hypothetical protein